MWRLIAQASAPLTLPPPGPQPDTMTDELRTCRQMVTEALAYSAAIGQVAGELQALGGEVSPKTVRCLKTSNPFAIASYHWASSPHGERGTITVHAQNAAQSTFSGVQRALLHELIHAFDAYRADMSSCRAIACSEVRAYRLDGSCDMKDHFLGWLQKVPKPGPFPSSDDCLRERAVTALKTNHPRCVADADATVSGVMSTCRKDLEPLLHARVRVIGLPEGSTPLVPN